MPSTATTCDQIRSLHRDRVFYMKQRMRIYASLGAYLRLQFGWTPTLAKAECDAIQKRSLDLIKCGLAVMAEKPAPFANSDEYQNNRIQIEATINSAHVFEVRETEVVKQMEALAKTLPVWESFGKDVNGFGVRSLATIVGECGNLSHYQGDRQRGYKKLWKRLGISVINGIAQGRLPKGAAAEEWIEHGYNKERRSRMFVIGDTMLKKESPYRDLYLKRKEYERAEAERQGLTVLPSAKIPKNEAKRKLYRSEGHIHRRAQRFMEQKFTRDLWKNWHKAA